MEHRNLRQHLNDDTGGARPPPVFFSKVKIKKDKEG